MRIEILLVVLCSSLSLARPRESKQLFNWLFGGFGSGTSDDQVSNIGENVRPGVVPSQMLQRRSNQFALEEQTRGLARGRVLNRPPPPSLGGPVKSYRPPPPPGPVRRPLDKVPAPVIISGYASNVVQLGTKEDQRRVQESIEKYEKLNEISDEDVEEKIVPEIVDEEEISTEEVVTEPVREKVEKTTEKETESTTVGVEAVEADFEAKVEASVELIPKTEEKIEEKTDKTSDNEIVEFEYVDTENPYLPNIPENLDEDIHGAHPEVVKETFQAGYKEIEPVKTNLGDRHDQPAKPQKPLIQKQSAAYPLGKPQRQRPPFKPNKPAAKPQTDGSFLDFLPFFKSSKAKPRRPIGPPPPRPASSHKVTQLEHNPDYPKGLQAPLLLKVDDPQEEVPVRPEVVDKVGLSSRIDNTLHTEHTDNDDDAFVVLPSHDVKPTLVRTQPKRPRIPPPGPSKQFARPPPPRPLKPRLPNEGPLPMLSEPVIGLPQVPASRKQAPFLPKRPLLPPQLPQNFPGAPKNPLNKPPVQLKKPQVPLRKPQFPLNKPPVSLNKPLIKPPGPLKKPQVPLNKPQAPLNKPQAPVNKAPEKVTKKPFDKIFKKPLGAGLSPKVIAKLTSQTKVPDSKKPFDFRPNGAGSQPTSDITSHLSSLMNYFLRTTPSPIPAPSLPSLVEDTEFADIVHGYKPSDKNQTELGTTEKNTENKTTKLPNLVSTSSTPTPTVKVNKVSDETYDALDSLTAPVVQKPPRKFNNVLNLRSKPRPVTVPQPRPRLPLPPTTAKSYTSFTSPTSSTTTPPTTVRISTTSPPPVPTTITPRLITTTASSNSVFKSNEGITFSAPIQALVEEYQQKGHVVDQESYPQPVLQAIKKNFEHKKNIFEQFVTFDETDKAFIPNKEVVNSDWSLDTSGLVSDLSDKILVYQTLSPVGAAPTSTLAPPPRPTQTDDSIRRNSSPTFPNERNAEGGFRPMLRPLHSPLLNQ